MGPFSPTGEFSFRWPGEQQEKSRSIQARLFSIRIVMKIAVLLGSALRGSVIDHLADHGITISAVVLPAGERYASLREHVEVRAGPVFSVDQQDLKSLLDDLQPEVLLSIGWPHLLGREILSGPWVSLNSHPTLLPKYRGPSPWFDVLANGETMTGVTIHKIDEGMDSGPILHQEEVPLTPFDTYRSLRSKVLTLEPKVVLIALEHLQAGNAQFVPQDVDEATTFAVRRKPHHSEIDPNVPLVDLIDRIRACDPDAFPAFFHYKGQKVCIRLWRPERPSADHPESL
jgi:methionyl-tRNA formyltransferase